VLIIRKSRNQILDVERTVALPIRLVPPTAPGGRQATAAMGAIHARLRSDEKEDPAPMKGDAHERRDITSLAAAAYATGWPR
jgi:hypothetical protein